MNKPIDQSVKPSIFTREFAAPRQLVFDAWTQPEHLRNWMFPMPGVTCEYMASNIVTGGSSLHKMSFPNGHEMWLLTKYESVESPEKIVFRQYNSNAEGDILPNMQMPDWPKEMRATVLFEEVNGNTRLELIWEPVDASQAERDTFEASRSQHGNGWEGGFDQLISYLKTL
ncbi:MAG: SRPBCC domain-containing protein [FCB group bacterium]|nr:SRPBCC domain-containing protein [FCB group bacterium]MBL7028401.1 SRPBCC domain-containing protein [Candidatus Neomarinimicrobiota bacterium]MBL7122315.1 SRPBCC domain-containing protein [Candidatus Neomarinimicrobiota bacterium]